MRNVWQGHTYYVVGDLPDDTAWYAYNSAPGVDPFGINVRLNAFIVVKDAPLLGGNCLPSDTRLRYIEALAPNTNRDVLEAARGGTYRRLHVFNDVQLFITEEP